MLLITTRDHNRDAQGMQMMQLALELSLRGHQVTVIYRFAPNTSRQFSAYYGSNVVVIRSAAKPNWRGQAHFRFARDVRHILKEGDFDLIHSFDDALPIALIAAFGIAVRIVANCDQASGKNRLINLCYRLRKVSLVVATSAEIRDSLMERCGVDGDKVPVVYDGVDLGQFRPRTDAARLRQEAGIDADAFVIACESGVNDLAGQNSKLITLINAFNRLIPRYPKCLLLLRHTSEDRWRHERAVPGRLAKHVQFYVIDGCREEFLATADLYISQNDTAGKISHDVVEAAATQVLVIAGNAGANCELIHRLKTGLLVDLDSHHEIVDAVAYILENPAQARVMADRAFQSVVSRMSSNVRANHLIALYRQILTSVPDPAPAAGHAEI